MDSRSKQMSDAERTEKAVIELRAKEEAPFESDESITYGKGIRAGIEWRDNNPSEKVESLEQALERIEKGLVPEWSTLIPFYVNADALRGWAREALAKYRSQNPIQPEQTQSGGNLPKTTENAEIGSKNSDEKQRDRLASHSAESEFSDECDQAIARLQFPKGWSASRKVQDDRVAKLEAKLAKAVEQRNALYDLLQENSFGVYSADEAAQDIASDDVELLTVGSVVESERANASNGMKSIAQIAGEE